MYTATLDGQQLPDDVDVRIDGWPRVDYLSRSVQSGKASLTFTSRGWADDYRGQACEVRRDHDDLLIMRGVVSSQSVAVGLSSSIVTLSVESGERRVKRSWPTDHLEDDGRFPLNVSGVVQRVFGSVESVPLPEVRTGFRLVARNPIYGDPNNIGTIDVYEGDVLVAEDRPIQRIEDGLGEVYSVIEVDYRKLNVSVVPIAGETTIEFGVDNSGKSCSSRSSRYSTRSALRIAKCIQVSATTATANNNIKLLCHTPITSFNIPKVNGSKKPPKPPKMCLGSCISMGCIYAYSQSIFKRSGHIRQLSLDQRRLRPS